MQYDIARIVTFSLGVCLDARFSHQQKCNCAVAYAAAALVRLAEDWNTFFFDSWIGHFICFQKLWFLRRTQSWPWQSNLGALVLLCELADCTLRLILRWLVYGVDWKNLLKDGWGGIFGRRT